MTVISLSSLVFQMLSVQCTSQTPGIPEFTGSFVPTAAVCTDWFVSVPYWLLAFWGITSATDSAFHKAVVLGSCHSTSLHK
jgi:hypothetical protein